MDEQQPVDVDVGLRSKIDSWRLHNASLLVVTSASLVVTSALLVVTRS